MAFERIVPVQQTWLRIEWIKPHELWIKTHLTGQFSVLKPETYDKNKKIYEVFKICITYKDINVQFNELTSTLRGSQKTVYIHTHIHVVKYCVKASKW